MTEGSADVHLDFLFNKNRSVWTCLKRIHVGTNGKNVQDELIKLLKTLKDEEKYITEGSELWDSSDVQVCEYKENVAERGKTLYTVIRCDPAGGYLSEDTVIYIEEDIKPLKSIHLLWDIHSDFSNYAAIFTPSSSDITKESILDRVYGPFFVKNTRSGLEHEVEDVKKNRGTKNCNLRILSMVLERPDDESAISQISYAPDPLGDSPNRSSQDEGYLNLKRKSVLADISEIRQNVMCNMQQEDPFLYENAFFRDSAFLIDSDFGPVRGYADNIEESLNAEPSSIHSGGLNSGAIKTANGGTKLFASMFKNYVSDQLASDFRIFYFGKSFYIGDLKFIVSNLEPANKPGYISRKTKIYFHVDSVHEYSKVTVAPLVDTLPTLYQYDLLNDHVKPFFRLNSHRIFHKGDVFKHSGIQFRIQEATIGGSIFSIFKEAKSGRVGNNTEIVVADPVRPRVLDLLSPQKVAILRETPPCYRESLFAKFTSELDHESLVRLHDTESHSSVVHDVNVNNTLLNSLTPSNRSDIHYTLKCTVCYEPIYTRGTTHRHDTSKGNFNEERDEVTPSTVADTPSTLFEPVNIKRLPCGHVFHKGCVYTWALNKNSCPNCRLQIDASENCDVGAPLVYNLSDEEQDSLEDSDSYGTTNCNSLSDMEEYFKSLEI